MKRDEQRGWTMSIAGLIGAVGLGLVVRGVWLAWRPGGWILAGVFVAVPAVLIAYGAFREK